MDVAAAKARQQQVEHDRIRSDRIEAPQCVDTVFDGEHEIPGGGKRRAIEVSQPRIVFDDQYRCCGRSNEHDGILASIPSIPNMKDG